MLLVYMKKHWLLHQKPNDTFAFLAENAPLCGAFFIFINDGFSNLKY